MDAYVHWDEVATAAFIAESDRSAVSQLAEGVGDRLRTFGPRRTGALVASVHELPGMDAAGPFEDVSAIGYEVFQNPSHKIYHPSTGLVHGRSAPRFGFYAATAAEAADNVLL